MSVEVKVTADYADDVREQLRSLLGEEQYGNDFPSEEEARDLAQRVYDGVKAAADAGDPDILKDGVRAMLWWLVDCGEEPPSWGPENYPEVYADPGE